MSFTSIIFVLFFLPALIACYYIIPSKYLNLRNVVLLLFSIVFYAWGGVRYLGLLFASIMLNYISGVLLGAFQTKQSKRTAVLVLSVILNLSLLGIFKYSNFVTSSLAQLNSNIYVTHFVLPIGISFYTFQGLSYVIDVYRNKAAVAKNPITIALYISLFPQLVAGPIVRYTDVERELSCRASSFEDFSSGAVRFMFGFGKKMILANSVGKIADEVFSQTGTTLLSTPLAWLGAIAFTLQIYLDFSAYSDMAIGLGKIIGFHFNENFNYPYISSSITEFWRRWHMSLSSWFRDYIYIPLGGNRCGVPRQIFNLIVVWSLTGMWHGANWTFILWGLYYGILLIFEKFVIGKSIEKIPRPVRHVITMFFVIIGWVLFRSESISSAIGYLGVMFGGGGNALPEFVYLIREYAVVLVLSFIAVLPVKEWILLRIKKSDKTPVLVQISCFLFAIIVFLLSYMKMVSGSFMPFIYFQF